MSQAQQQPWTSPQLDVVAIILEQEILSVAFALLSCSLRLCRVLDLVCQQALLKLQQARVSARM